MTDIKAVAVAHAVIANAEPGLIAQLLDAAIERAADLGRPAWEALATEINGQPEEYLDEALEWLSDISSGKLPA